MNNKIDPDKQDCFPATEWTTISQAKEGGEQTVRDALSGLCYTYWKPVYTYIRHKGKSSHDAEDLTQGFFSDLLGRNFLQSVNSQKGKFRSFLLSSVKNYLAKDWRKKSSQKRGEGILPLNFEEAENYFSAQENTHLSPDLAFDRHWVISLLDTVLSSLEKEYQKAGKSNLFAALKGDLVESGQNLSLSELANKLDMQEGAVKVAQHRLKKRYQDALKNEIARTIACNDKVEIELNYLISVFSQ